jgi:diguanylate cyclase (GGDEF)-like protein
MTETAFNNPSQADLALELFYKRLEQLVVVSSYDFRHPDFIAWKDATMGLFQRFLQPESPHLIRFRDLRFRGPAQAARRLPFNYRGPLPRSREAVTPADEEAFHRGCELAERCIKGAIDDIQHFGVYIEDYSATKGRPSKGHFELPTHVVPTTAKANNGTVAEELDDRLPLLRTKSFDPDQEHCVKEAKESGFPLALVIIDVDNFGQFNKQHSLEIGNEVLISVAHILNERTRGKGKAYRYGGDEMSILLPNYSKGEAFALAEAIRRQVDGSTVTAKELKVTITLGVASLPEDAQNAKDLFNAANGALQAAKNLGRNRVSAAGETQGKAELISPAKTSGTKEADGEVKAGSTVKLKTGSP